MIESLEDWKDLALFLADCEAATAEHLALLKSASKAERRRHADICEQVAISLERGCFIGRARPLEPVLKRVKDAVASCRKQV